MFLKEKLNNSPWITKGIETAIRKKNQLFKSNNLEKYKLYRNMIPTLTRASKKSYYHSFFSQNISNMKKMWEGIRELIGGKRGNRKSINAIRVNKSSPLVHEPSKVANIMNAHFASSGQQPVCS